MRGNVVDLAVVWIIGAAFGKIVSSLVAGYYHAAAGLLIGGIDFKQFAVTLRDAQGDVPAVVMHYGYSFRTFSISSSSRLPSSWRLN